MPRLIIVRGTICAGKTTTATLLRERFPSAALIEEDIFKHMIDMSASSLWRRRMAHRAVSFLLNELFKKRRDIIVTLHGQDVRRATLYIKSARARGYRAESFLLRIPLALSLKRNGTRGVPGMKYGISSRKIRKFYADTRILRGERVIDSIGLLPYQVVSEIVHAKAPV